MLLPQSGTQFPSELASVCGDPGPPTLVLPCSPNARVFWKSLHLDSFVHLCSCIRVRPIAPNLLPCVYLCMPWILATSARWVYFILSHCCIMLHDVDGICPFICDVPPSLVP